MKNPEDRIPFVLEMLYPTAYLADKIADDPNGRTYRDKQIEVGIISTRATFQILLTILTSNL